jgi:DNA-binding NarL/FixJ family response regulator
VPARVIVLEDDPLVRRRIVSEIAAHPAFVVVAEAGDLDAGRRAIETSGAAVGVFDLQLADGNATPLIRRAVEHRIAVLVLTVWADDEKVYRALAAGAAGYLLKSDATSRITTSLEILQDGGAAISPTIARRLLADLRARAVPPPPVLAVEASELTVREREILELFAKGATYEEVGRMLGMSVNTVRHHVRGMYRKLHVSSKAEAVHAVFRPG